MKPQMRCQISRKGRFHKKRVFFKMFFHEVLTAIDLRKYRVHVCFYNVWLQSQLRIKYLYKPNVFIPFFMCKHRESILRDATYREDPYRHSDPTHCELFLNKSINRLSWGPKVPPTCDNFIYCAFEVCIHLQFGLAS